MNSLSNSFNHWLKHLGPDQVIKALTNLIDTTTALAVDVNGNILYWSNGAEKLLGWSSTEVLGKPYTEILSSDKSHTHLTIDNQKVVNLHKKDHTSINCNQSVHIFIDVDDRYAGALVLLKPQNTLNPLFDKQEDITSFHGILTQDPIMRESIKIIRNVSETEATVLIRGESGTGKELVAQALHLESLRRDNHFLAINCAALTPNLLESELFGHVKGAFTGAIKNHEGLFQRANGGTLFLDEVAELPLELQSKLLRVLQEQSFIPVGGHEAVKVDVRIIAATHRSLREEVKAGRFREDLMYRLRVVPVFLPPLRDRRLDVNLLLWHRINKHNLHSRRHIDSISPEAMRCLLDYKWPGNVRELINVIEYAYAVGRGNELRVDDLPPEFRESLALLTTNSLLPLKRPKSQDEAELIREALKIAGGHLETAAQYAGMSRATFWRKRKKHKIES
ncbi:MAG: PAS domain-containing protein [Methylococcales bacterium]|nr:MAG: PAS domain-containing protein [Methylococcales bacterium]